MKMKLKLPRTNIELQLLKSRNKRIYKKQGVKPTGRNNILQQVQVIFNQEKIKEDNIRERLASGNTSYSNTFDFDLLQSEQIFHISDIEQVCIDYRLRFLDSKFFKAEIPSEAISKIKQLEKQHQTELKNFKIIAPAKLLKLENADDPLLFTPMGNNYFYLIHKWGKDLSTFRKVYMWPFKSLENFAITLLAGSFLLALLVPDGMFSPKQSTTEFFMIFFFIFKWIAGLAIFYGFKYGKNFNAEIWQSKYYNA